MLWVNDVKYEFEILPQATLLELLRYELKLCGTKRGCGEGECGACTVIMDGKAVNSCLIPALKANGSKVTTVEGLVQVNKLHPLQEAFMEHGGLHCGFCTPGMLMSAYALLMQNPSPNKEEIKSAIAGNLCRCTGYNQIVESIKAGAERISAGGE